MAGLVARAQALGCECGAPIPQLGLAALVAPAAPEAPKALIS